MRSNETLFILSSGYLLQHRSVRTITEHPIYIAITSPQVTNAVASSDPIDTNNVNEMPRVLFSFFFFAQQPWADCV
jgi:hypothetical protein